MASIYVQYGCGYEAPDGWLNFDSSPSLRLSRTPVVGRWLYKITGNAQPFPAAVRYGDIVQGLPVANGTCDGIYASHVLEHLSRSDCETALRHTFNLLKPGGILRLVVPDLEGRARRYLRDLEEGRADANDRFLRACHLGAEARPRNLVVRLRKIYGAADHLWMYDLPAMAELLAMTGFTGIRRCDFGDSKDPMFRVVENPERFHDGLIDVRELAMEALRPFDS